LLYNHGDKEDGALYAGKLFLTKRSRCLIIGSVMGIGMPVLEGGVLQFYSIKFGLPALSTRFAA